MLAREARVMTTFFVGRGDDRTDSAGTSEAAILTASPGAPPVSETPLGSSAWGEREMGEVSWVLIEGISGVSFESGRSLEMAAAAAASRARVA